MEPISFPAFDSPRASIVILAWKQADLLLECLGALATTLTDRIPYEVVIVMNGASDAVQDAARKYVSGATIVPSDVNMGFSGGCNRGAAEAKGEFIVLLNDDAIVDAGWLEALVTTADAHPEAGAVGSRILFPDGRLQEVGSLIWRDGSTMPLGRGESGQSLDWQYVREVDYASACSLLVRRTTWQAVGGMDEGYRPAYYEDVDLCLAIRRRGQRVLVDPRSSVRHHESASSEASFKSFLFKRNQARLKDKWAQDLGAYEPAEPWLPASVARAVWSSRGCPRRILILDDHVPERGLGSGFGRMCDAIAELAAEGYAVSLYPTSRHLRTTNDLIAAGVNIIDGDLGEHLALPSTVYDVVIVSRPHNFERLAATVRRFQPCAPIVYDCEALFWRRVARQAQLAPSSAERRALSEEANRLREVETWIAREANHVVSVSADEAKFLAGAAGEHRVSVVPPTEPHVEPTNRRFRDRRDSGFVAGWMAGADSPNGDGLRWFAKDVLPHVRRQLPWFRLRVTGARPPEAIRELANPNIVFEGFVSDLRAFYDAVRVDVVPLRYGAGVKLKTIEALQHGVPVVATTIGAEGVDVAGEPAIEVVDDPELFARAMVALMTDEDRWLERRAAVSRLLERWKPAAEERQWSRIVGRVIDATRRQETV